MKMPKKVFSFKTSKVMETLRKKVKDKSEQIKDKIDLVGLTKKLSERRDKILEKIKGEKE